MSLPVVLVDLGIQRLQAVGAVVHVDAVPWDQSSESSQLSQDKPGNLKIKVIKAWNSSNMKMKSGKYPHF